MLLWPVLLLSLLFSSHSISKLLSSPGHWPCKWCLAGSWVKTLKRAESLANGKKPCCSSLSSPEPRPLQMAMLGFVSVRKKMRDIWRTVLGLWDLPGKAATATSCFVVRGKRMYLNYYDSSSHKHPLKLLESAYFMLLHKREMVSSHDGITQFSQLQKDGPDSLTPFPLQWS